MEDNRPASGRGGVFDCILINLAFIFAQFVFSASFHGAAFSFYFADGILRIVFGTATLFLFVKRFEKGKWTNVIHFRNFKAGLSAAAGSVLLILFYVLLLATGAKSIEIPAQMIFGEIIFQQITTGYFEEMLFRAYLMEGYYSALSAEERTWGQRLYYSILSALIFGAIHISGAGSLVTPVFAAAFGFICASAYLYSHNILVCMLLHFVYDVFAHCPKYVAEWDETNLLVLWNEPIFFTLLSIGLLIAVVYLMKEPVDERENAA